MKHIFKAVYVNLLIISSFSCVQIIELDENNTTSKLVVNGVLNPDSVFKVHLSKSVSVLDFDKFIDVADKKISIFQNHSFVEDLKYIGNGYYATEKITPYPDATYELNVETIRNENVSSSVTLPLAPEIMEIKTVSLKNNTVELNIIFNDPEPATNYYRISLEEINSTNKSGSSPSGQKVVFKNIDLEQSNFLKSMGSFLDQEIIDENAILNKYYIFSDQRINGQEVTLKIVTPVNFGSNSDYSFMVNLQALDENYFNYLKTISIQNNFAKNNFVEPIGIVTNITNGMGIFGAVVPAKKMVTVTK